MKKYMQRLVFAVFAVILAAAILPVSARAAESETCGGIDWVFSDGTLTISPASEPAEGPNPTRVYGVGEWPEIVSYDAAGNFTGYGTYFVDPNMVYKLIIEEGVTSIGSFAAKFPNLTGEVVIPSTVTYIGQEAFQNSPITTLTFAPGGTGELCIAPGAFKKLAITELILPADRPKIHLHSWTFNSCNELINVSLPANVEFAVQTHLDYYGEEDFDYIAGWDNNILAYCTKIERIAFGSEEVKTSFYAAKDNGKSMSLLPKLKTYIHTCAEGLWVRNENAHYKKGCVYADCPLERNLKYYAYGAHTFGADNFCTVCGYLRSEEATAAPKTGDTTHTLLWSALFCIGVAMMWMQLSTRKQELF